MKETHFLGQVTQKALIEKDGKFLFLKYPVNHPQAHGFWDIPGGRLNEGENPVEGLEREVFEEVGQKIFVKDILATDTFINLTNKQNFLVLYRAELVVTQAPMTLQESEVSEARWFTREEMLELPIYYPVHRNLVRRLIQEGKL